MAKRFTRFILSLVLVIVSWGYATASTDLAGPQESPRLNLSIGHVGLADGLDHPYRFGVEYSARPLNSWKLIPNIGAVWAVNDSSYLYAGFQRDFPMTASLILAPSFGVGFFEESKELRLGHSLEFRSGLTVAYRFSGGAGWALPSTTCPTPVLPIVIQAQSRRYWRSLCRFKFLFQ